MKIALLLLTALALTGCPRIEQPRSCPSGYVLTYQSRRTPVEMCEPGVLPR